MVQILPRNPGFLERIGLGLSEGLPQAIEGFGELRQQQQAAKEKSDFLKRLSGQQPAIVGEERFVESIGNEPRKVGTESFNPLSIPNAVILEGALSKDADIRRAAETTRKLKESAQNIQQKEKEFERNESRKYLSRINEEAESLPNRKSALVAARAAVQSGEMRPLGADFWANALNMPQLKTTSGAALEASAKFNLVNSLSSIPGGRPNLFLDKQINEAFARAGEKKEAQLVKLAIADAEYDLVNRKSEIANELAQSYRQQLGYVPAHIDSDVNGLVRQYAEKRMAKLNYDVKDLIEQGMTKEALEKNALNDVTKGTPLTLRMRDILVKKVGGDRALAAKLAERLGYTFPSPEVFER